ncbi:anti-sigma F factor antagonist [Clostridium massiliamazoniense]|uniref:anti-sigma F factor antagonist n=1 Tax=Clostridium massiliamazoniense TaxID=1347366 RepID=UPI0006D775D3|nr:anti-sigma F factor antagonist [Clostridium massiliamazoniense]
MYIDFNRKNDCLIVKLIGELDHHSAEEVRVKIDDRIDRNNEEKLIFDFSSVSFMDSSGIGVIIGRYKKIMMRNGKVAIADVNSRIKRVFELSGMFKIIKVYETVEDAIEAM